MKNNIELLTEWYSEVQQIINLLDLITADYGLSFTTFRMLDQLYQNEPLTPGQLSNSEKTSRPAVSRKLNLLQKKGYIRKRRDDPYDQRIVRLEMTVEGKNVYLEIQKKVNEDINHLLHEVKELSHISDNLEINL